MKPSFAGSKTSRRQPRKRVGGSKTIEIMPKKAIAPAIKSLHKSVRKIQLSEELNHLDTLVATTIGTTAVVTVLNSMAVGDTNITRDGNQIIMTSLQFRFIANNNVSAAAGHSQMIRHLIVADRQPVGANPGIGDILDNTVITNNLIAPYNSNTQMRFKILYDRLSIVKPALVTGFTPATGATTTVNSVDLYTRRKRKMNRKALYNASTAGVGTIQTNALFSILVSDDNTNQPSVSVGYRLIFKDI